ncbi:MAG: hypothetical protein AAGA12_11840 [Pseudomonadota bacterium]
MAVVAVLGSGLIGFIAAIFAFLSFDLSALTSIVIYFGCAFTALLGIGLSFMLRDSFGSAESPALPSSTSQDDPIEEDPLAHATP